MPITNFHAKLFAYELTKRCASDNIEKLASVLADAQVDLNPHQVEAALFAFRSPFSKGAILADEVGLGKTIEAGLLLAQRWAERRRHLLVIVPLAPCADFDVKGYSFTLRTNPFPVEAIHPGPYRMGKGVEDVNLYRVGHPLAQRVLERGKAIDSPLCEVSFQYTGSGKNIGVLDSLRGRSGWLTCERLSLTALESEDWIVLAALTDDGETLDESQCRRLFDLPGTEGPPVSMSEGVAGTLRVLLDKRRSALLEEASSRNGNWFEVEMDKLDRWAEDRRASLKSDLDELDRMLKDIRKLARVAPTLPQKLEHQRQARMLEAKRDEAWRAYDQASREVDRQKDALLDEISRRMEQRLEQEPLFGLRWRLI